VANFLFPQPINTREILHNTLHLESKAIMKDLDQISQNVAQILMDNVKQLISDILIYIILIFTRHPERILLFLIHIDPNSML